LRRGRRARRWRWKKGRGVRGARRCRRQRWRRGAWRQNLVAAPAVSGRARPGERLVSGVL
jgi:hypothetical protein